MSLHLDDYVITFMHGGFSQPKCSGFAWDKYTIITCAHCNVDPNQFVLHKGGIRTLPRKVVSLVDEDVAFLTSSCTHGFPVLPHAVPAITLKETCHVVPQYRPNDRGPRPCNEAETWAGPHRKWMHNANTGKDAQPMVFPYHFHNGGSERDVRAFGSSGSPVVNAKGELLGMHTQSDWEDGMGYAVPLFQLQKLWRQVKHQL